MIYTDSMSRSTRIPIIVSTVFLVGAGLYFRFLRTENSGTVASQAPTVTVPGPVVERPPADVPTQVPAAPGMTSETAPKETEVNDVPFFVQAPSAQWGDPIFQDGCEEASMLMAMGWVRGTTYVSASQESDAIIKLAGFEVSRLGHHEDVSLSEIITVLRENLRYDQATRLDDATPRDIERELSDGNIVLAPTFGQALHNPNFTAPGPITHMLVLTGYDPSAHEFIVNDPGTKHGKNYRYDEKILFDAIWAYPAGKTHPPAPAPSERTKSVIVVRPGA